MFFLILLILDSIPLSENLICYRPSLFFLFFVYKIVFLSYEIRIWLIFSFGIIIDIIQNYNIGVHSLSYVLVYYFIFKKKYIFRNMLLLNQCFFIFLLSLIVNFIVFFSKFLFYIDYRIVINSIIHSVVWFFLKKNKF